MRWSKSPFTPPSDAPGASKSPFTPPSDAPGASKSPFTPSSDAPGASKSPFTPSSGAPGTSKRAFTPPKGDYPLYLMRLVGKGKEFAVATAVAIGSKVVGGTVGMAVEDATHLLLTVAVGGEEASGEPAVDNFDPSAQDGDGREEGPHPVVDGGADDEYLSPVCLSLPEDGHGIGAQQAAAVCGEAAAEIVEGRQAHPPEEPREDALLGPAVRIEPQRHQHQQGRVDQESEDEAGRAAGIADNGNERVARGQRPVEVEGVDLFHSISWRMECGGRFLLREKEYGP